MTNFSDGAIAPINDADFSPEGGPVLRELILFVGVSFAITTALTWYYWRLPPDFTVGDVAAIRRAVNDVGGLAILAPVLTAIAVTLTFRGWRGVLAMLGRVVTFRAAPRYYAIALLFPPVPQWVAAILWQRYMGVELAFPEFGRFAISWAQLTIAGSIVFLCEEIGWRGFMLPRLLTRFGWRSAALIGGAIWAGWHIPFWAPANYAATGTVHQTAIALLANSLGAVGLSIVITWLFLRTRYSVAIPALLHGSGNGSMGHIYDMLGDGAGTSSTWVVGYNLLLFAAAAVFLFLPDKKQD